MNERKNHAARIWSDAEFYAAVREKYHRMRAIERKRRARIRSALALLFVCLLPLPLLFMPQSTEAPNGLPQHSDENGLPAPEEITNGLYLSYGLTAVELDDEELVASLYACLQALGEASSKEENHIKTTEAAVTRPAEYDHPVDDVTIKDAENVREEVTATGTTVDGTPPISDGALSPDENATETVRSEYTLTFTESGVSEIYVLSGKRLYREEDGRRVLLRILSDAEFAALTTRLNALLPSE